MEINSGDLQEDFFEILENFSEKGISLLSEENVRRKEPENLPTPPENLDSLPEWVSSYLSGEINGELNQAHQFTLNHVTFPFVRDLHFAAIPWVPPLSASSGEINGQVLKRQFELFSGALLVSPGDLMFFYKSDTQQESTSDYDVYENNLERNRGIMGIYRALSGAYLDPSQISHSESNYKISGSCPNCGNMFSWMRGDSKSSPNNSDIDDCWCPGSSLYNYEDHRNESTDEGSLTLACRFDLEPLKLFRNPAVDNTVYGDLEGESVIWTGRFDNRPGGWGKGSTVRHLLPEEAKKLTRIIATQAKKLGDDFDDYTGVEEKSKNPYPGSQSVFPPIHHNGTPLTYGWVKLAKRFKKLEDLSGIGNKTAEKIREAGFRSLGDIESAMKSERDALMNIPGIGSKTVGKWEDDFENRESEVWQVRQENVLFLQMCQMVKRQSNLTEELSNILSIGTDTLIEDLEFYSWEFPWGFANDQCDFLCTYRDEERYQAVLFENKKGKVGNGALVELMLYVPWVVKVLLRYADPLPSDFSITPILVGNESSQSLTLTEEMNELQFQNQKGQELEYDVERSYFLEYNIPKDKVFKVGNEYFSKEITFSDSSSNLPRDSWKSSLSALSATSKEEDWVKERWPFNI